MGSSCSPNYANLFMSKFEEDFVYNNPYLNFLNCWYRYIDDIFYLFSQIRWPKLSFDGLSLHLLLICTPVFVTI